MATHGGGRRAPSVRAGMAARTEMVGSLKVAWRTSARSILVGVAAVLGVTVRWLGESSLTSPSWVLPSRVRTVPARQIAGNRHSAVTVIVRRAPLRVAAKRGD